jgi:hypothetical protein
MKTNKDQIGELLIEKDLITETQLQSALDIQEKTGSKLGEILIAQNYIRAVDFYSVLAENLELNSGSQQLDHFASMIQIDLLEKFNAENYVINYFFPLYIEEETLKVLVVDQTDQKVDNIIKKKFPGVKIEKIIVTQRDIIQMMKRFLSDKMINKSVNGLFYRSPEESALRVFTPAQVVFALIAVLILTFGIFYYPEITFIILVYLFNFFFLASVLYKFVISIFGSFREEKVFISEEEVNNIDENQLPIYTILVPVYKECKVIEKLIEAFKNLDYPQSKLNILFLFEEDDRITLKKAKKEDPPDNWQFIIVPTSSPKTKPKACNYGLEHASGKYLTIYDAEDIPEADQLKKAYLAFEKSDENFVCFQAALNYFNKDENLLTKLFTIEYSYWFDYILPGLDLLKLPIPLGGTSNHFKIEKLRELGGWDPFNVTEDADLGIRANARGYRVGILNSTTFEEANNNFINWIRQRSRWLKGYMQTFLVHNRHPIKFIKEVGFKGWLTLQIFIGGTVITHLVSPFFWLLFIFWLISGFTVFSELFNNTLIYISLINLLFGNFLGIYLSTIAVFKRKYYDLIYYSLLDPFYNILKSIAAWKAFGQLFLNPFYWEKTEHGLTSEEVKSNA